MTPAIFIPPGPAAAPATQPTAHCAFATLWEVMQSGPLSLSAVCYFRGFMSIVTASLLLKLCVNSVEQQSEAIQFTKNYLCIGVLSVYSHVKLLREKQGRQTIKTDLFCLLSLYCSFRPTKTVVVRNLKQVNHVVSCPPFS